MCHGRLATVDPHGEDAQGHPRTGQLHVHKHKPSSGDGNLMEAWSEPILLVQVATLQFRALCRTGQRETKHTAVPVCRASAQQLTPRPPGHQTSTTTSRKEAWTSNPSEELEAMLVNELKNL